MKESHPSEIKTKTTRRRQKRNPTSSPHRRTPMETITITTEYIKLQDLLKLAAVTATAAKCQGMEPKSTARAEKKP